MSQVLLPRKLQMYDTANDKICENLPLTIKEVVSVEESASLKILSSLLQFFIFTLSGLNFHLNFTINIIIVSING